ncbi:DUF6671 family protein [Rheinheimera aquimaris]|uniref:DUF6671 family protein n=1 Tax=Rheinheimera aquimaris TaxID=412437 RepID=UPI001E5E6A97|nr:DUF6671 family protein [Rheinheimera aquimaris]
MATSQTMMRRVALLTSHNKGRLISPALLELGWQLTELDSFDTDSLGSFAGERPRFMSPDECALRKAAIAAELSGYDTGIGSEGSFAPGPYGIGTFDLELICCVNISAGWAVTGRFYGPTNVQQWTISNNEALDQALASVPEGQKLLVQQHRYIRKGLSPAEARQQAGSLLINGGEFILGFDLRAHCCPERQQHIRLAAADLVQRIKHQCARCSTPGFWPDKPISGLPCEECGTPSTLTQARQACCQRCGYTETYGSEQRYAAALYCQVCNP